MAAAISNTVLIADGKHTEHIKDEKHALTKIDIAFILDCTGSMQPYIESARDNIVAIANKIQTECENCDPSFGLVLYRDIPRHFDVSHPEDNVNGFITQIFQFTPVPFQIELKLHSVDALGGGDTPECLTSALYACLTQLNWAKTSIKIIIIITDAPPHGLEVKVHDDYPNGDINTFMAQKEGKTDQETRYLNILDIIKSIRNKLKASIYSVVCEPNISCDFDFAHDFFTYIAETTHGKFLPLSKAELLPNVIVGTVKQQISVHNLSQELQTEIQHIKKQYDNKISSAELNKLIKDKWKDKHVKKKDISIGTLYRKQRPRDNINLLLNEQKIETLQDFQKNAVLIPRYNISDFRHIRRKNVESKENSLSSSVLTKSFDELLADGHDIDRIGVAKNYSNEAQFAMFVYKKSRYIGVWRERYLVLLKQGIVKTFKSKNMKTCTESIKVGDIADIRPNGKKFAATEFHIVCNKVTFQFKVKDMITKKMLINEINSTKRMLMNKEENDVKDMELSLSMNSQRAYSVERSLGSNSLSRIIRHNRNSV